MKTFLKVYSGICLINSETSRSHLLVSSFYYLFKIKQSRLLFVALYGHMIDLSVRYIYFSAIQRYNFYSIVQLLSKPYLTVAKRTDDEQIEKFRKDANFLLGLYTRKGMGDRLGEGKANFSNYLNGRKRPSPEKIAHFYDIYGKDLERYGKDIPEKLPVVQENMLSFGVDPTVDLKSIKDTLSEIKNMLANHYDQLDITELRLRVEKIENRLPPENE